MKRRNRFALLLTALLMLLLFSMPASAAGKEAKALKAYGKYLAKMAEDPGAKSFYSRFGLAYLNDDSVPELVTYGLMAPIGKPRVFTYRNNKVVMVNWSAGNDYYSHYYRRKCVLKGSAVDKKYDFSSAYILDFGKGKLTGIYSYDNGQYTKITAQGKAKKISAKKAASLLKKAVGKSKAVRIKYYDNTKKNRNKMINKPQVVVCRK